MAEAVEEAKGIGIAANQVGEPLRVAIVGREDGTFFEIQPAASGAPGTGRWRRAACRCRTCGRRPRATRR